MSYTPPIALQNREVDRDINIYIEDFLKAVEINLKDALNNHCNIFSFFSCNFSEIDLLRKPKSAIFVTLNKSVN